MTLPRTLCLLCALPSLAATAVSSGTLRGQVVDAQGKPVAGAVITLSQRISGYKQVVRGDAQGRYLVHNIPFSDYHLEVQAAGYRDLHQEVELRSALPLDLTVKLQEASAEVVVEESLEMVEDHPSVHLDIDKSSIRISPAPVRSRAMESILIATPGVIQDENGRFHLKGSHGQVMYVVDGIPVTDQMQLTFSNSLDPSQVESMEVITGGISAEHGGKPAAVVAVTSKSGLGTPDGVEGDVTFGVARFATAEAGLSLRGGSDHFGWFVTGAASRSDRFSDPVNFENLHNAGQTGRLFTRFDWVLGDSDTFRLSFGGGSTHREIPNLLSQAARDQDQRSVGTDANVSLAWTHLFSASRSLDVSAYVRHSRSRLEPSDEIAGPGSRDFPIWATQDRSLGNRGLQATYSQRFGAEDSVKAGLQYVAFPIHEAFRFTITDPADPELNSPLSPFYPYSPTGGGAIFNYDESIQSALASAFVQYDLHRGPLFLGLGLRADRYTVRDFTQAQVQPRLGLSYRTSFGPVLRASYDRLMITPENENLALSTSQQAWNLGPGAGTKVPPLRPELQDSLSYGLEQALGKQGRVSLEYWEKKSHNAADNEQFLNSGVLFPVAASRGLFRGLNLRLDYSFSKSFSTYVSFGKTRALFEAPVVGGLQLESPEAAAGERFLVDHDQKVSAQAGLRFEEEGFYTQLVGRYDSGLVSGDPGKAAGDPDLEFGTKYVRMDGEGTWRIKPRTIWNLSLGQRWKLSGRRSLEAGADLLNLTDEKGLYNFMSVFGGTHVIPPRTLAARIKFGF
ncbi:MAG TPA: TonB-dependent receptor [Holophagaceae bacterium]|nr:TonB-dependent receptor [Holophagaceae bacterium]